MWQAVDLKKLVRLRKKVPNIGSKGTDWNHYDIKKGPALRDFAV